MRGRHRLAVVSGVLGLLLAPVLSGCGGSAEPQPLPRPTASLSPSSASPTPPVLPAAAEEKTKAGAIAFAGNFIEMLNFAGATGDTQQLRTLYLPLCTRCEAIADGIDQTYSAGGNISGGSWHPASFRFYGIKNEVAFVDSFVDYDAQTLTKKQGAKPTVFPASKRNLKAFNLRWTGPEGWKTSALDPNQ